MDHKGNLESTSFCMRAESQLRSVEQSSGERRGADTAFVCIKSRLVFFLPRNITQSVIRQACQSVFELAEHFCFHRVVSDVMVWTEGLGVFFILKNTELNLPVPDVSSLNKTNKDFNYINEHIIIFLIV